MPESEGPTNIHQINDILSRHPNDPRMVTYGLALSQIPSPALAQRRKIIEIGMNERLFAFEDLFPGETQFLGLTLTKEHQTAALTDARKVGHTVDVRMGDLQAGLPNEWKGADLVMDIFSASNYLSSELTIQKLTDMLSHDGYMLIVNGDFFGGAADMVRNNLNNSFFHPVYIYDCRGEKPKINVSIYPKPTTAEEYQVKGLALLREHMKLAGFEITEEASLKDVIQHLEKMREITGEKLITNYDAMYVNSYNSMEKAGLRNIKRFLTPDGTGVVAQK